MSVNQMKKWISQQINVLNSIEVHRYFCHAQVPHNYAHKKLRPHHKTRERDYISAKQQNGGSKKILS